MTFGCEYGTVRVVHASKVKVIFFARREQKTRSILPHAGTMINCLGCASVVSLLSSALVHATLDSVFELTAPGFDFVRVYFFFVQINEISSEMYI